MNVCLMICSFYPPFPHGGVGSFAVDLAQGLVEKGHRISVISFYPQQVLQSKQTKLEWLDGVKVVRVPIPFENFPARVGLVLEKFYYSKLIRKLHQQEPFDLIECEDGLGMLAFGRLPRVPKVVRLHASQIYNDFVLQRKPTRSAHLFEKIWINRADYIIAVSDYVGKTTLELLNLKTRRRYEVIHYAIDTDHFKPDLALAPEKGLIIFTGVVAPRKGALELIRAMNIVFAQNAAAHLQIIGDNQYPDPKKPFSDEVIQQLETRYAGRVEFIGPQPRNTLPPRIQKAELCCFPSHVETFGIGILEAMALEKPVIYMKTGPGPEVVEDEVSGLLCNSLDPIDIAEKVLFLLDNPHKAREFGVHARQRVLQKFDKKEWILQNIDFYQHCIADYR